MLELRADRTGLFVVDFQEKLAGAMPQGDLARAQHNAETLLCAAEIFEMPVIATEQYPRGLGRTVGPIALALARRGVVPIEKQVFSAADLPLVAAALSTRPAWVLVGMETHVCVYQTAREIVRLGKAAHVVADACVSRSAENRAIGLDLCRAADAVVTSTEVVVFDLLKEAGGEAFRVLSRRIR